MMAHGGGAAAAAIAKAIKASGAIVGVTPEAFVLILRKTEKPLIVYSQGGFLSRNHQYLTSYKGFVFFTKSSEQLDLPRTVEVVIADKIWIPG